MDREFEERVKVLRRQFPGMTDVELFNAAIEYIQVKNQQPVNSQKPPLSRSEYFGLKLRLESERERLAGIIRSLFVTQAERDSAKLQMEELTKTEIELTNRYFQGK